MVCLWKRRGLLTPDPDFGFHIYAVSPWESLTATVEPSICEVAWKQFLVWILKYPLASLLSKLFSRFLIFPCPGWKIRWRAEKTQVWETLSLRARTVFHGLFLLSPQHSSQDSPSFYLTNPGKSWLGTSGPRMTVVWLRASFFFPWASVPTQAKQCK